MALTLRQAVGTDAVAVTSLHERAREAYYGELLDASDAAQDRLPTWQRMLADPHLVTIVAELAGQAVGFISVREAIAPGDVVELVSLYVLPSHFGTGVADRLYEQFLELRGTSAAHLEVWDGNARAKAFYERRMWRPTTQTRPGVKGIPFVTWHLDQRGGA